MEVKQNDNKHKGRFYIEIDGKVEGEMTYVWDGINKIVIDHTEVNESLKGKGAGKQLLHAAVTFARENELKIFPVCSFARSVFEKVPDYADVLFKKL
ncbi:MAG: GNAT family N-acetyltransferase [Bacteroidota bacterium]